jgi:DNA primase
MSINEELSREYHRNLPQRIRNYLRQERGIPDTVIDRFMLGWNGFRITIPIYDRTCGVVSFKLAKDPRDRTQSSKMVASPGGHAELYGWERVLAKPAAIMICEGELDRLVLESRGFAAVTSTGGAGTFRAEWAEAFCEITYVYICFDNDEAGRKGARRIAQLIPHARIVQLPDDVGDGGDVTDFFVRLGRSREEFLKLLKTAPRLPKDQRIEPPKVGDLRLQPTTDNEVEQLKQRITIEDLISRYVTLRRRGQSYVAQCPFHQDRNPSLVVYPQSETFYCFGCEAHGDALSFLMRIENLSFPEALKVFRELTPYDDPRHQRSS